jgi:PUCC protein
MIAVPLSWLGIVRLGLVQTALGALVALQYAAQVLRPRLGHGSDVGGRRTPWIVGGMTRQESATSQVPSIGKLCAPGVTGGGR